MKKKSKKDSHFVLKDTLLWRGWCAIDEDNTIYESYATEETAKMIYNDRLHYYEYPRKMYLVKAEIRIVK